MIFDTQTSCKWYIYISFCEFPWTSWMSCPSSRVLLAATQQIAVHRMCRCTRLNICIHCFRFTLRKVNHWESAYEWCITGRMHHKLLILCVWSISMGECGTPKLWWQQCKWPVRFPSDQGRAWMKATIHASSNKRESKKAVERMRAGQSKWPSIRKVNFAISISKGGLRWCRPTTSAWRQSQNSISSQLFSIF